MSSTNQPFNQSTIQPINQPNLYSSPQRHKFAIDASKADSQRVSFECERELDREEALKLYHADTPPEGLANDSQPDSLRLQPMIETVRENRVRRVEVFLEKIERDRTLLLKQIVAEEEDN